MTAQAGVDTFGRVGVAMVTPFDQDGGLDVSAHFVWDHGRITDDVVG